MRAAELGTGVITQGKMNTDPRQDTALKVAAKDQIPSIKKECQFAVAKRQLCLGKVRLGV